MIDSPTALKGGKTPIMIVIPGLTSDSASAVGSIHFLFFLCYLSQLSDLKRFSHLFRLKY